MCVYVCLSRMSVSASASVSLLISLSLSLSPYLSLCLSLPPSLSRSLSLLISSLSLSLSLSPSLSLSVSCAYVRLEVSVNNVFACKVLKRVPELDGNVSNNRFLERRVLFYVPLQIPCTAVLQQHLGMAESRC